MTRETKVTTVPGDYADVWEALGINRPSDEELRAAEKAARRQHARRNEDVDAWAWNLGRTFGKFTD